MAGGVAQVVGVSSGRIEVFFRFFLSLLAATSLDPLGNKIEPPNHSIHPNHLR